MNFDFLFRPFENLDAWLTSLIEGAPLPALGAFGLVFGLWYAGIT